MTIDSVLCKRGAVIKNPIPRFARDDSRASEAAVSKNRIPPPRFARGRDDKLLGYAKKGSGRLEGQRIIGSGGAKVRGEAG